MKLLCAPSNLGYLISLDIALQSEGIETFLSDADRVTAGLASGMVSAGRLYVLDDGEFERAMGIAESLERDADSETGKEAAPQATAAAGGGPVVSPPRTLFSRWLTTLLAALTLVLLTAILAHGR